MRFNPDVNKEAVQVIVSQKRKPLHPPLFYFNGSSVPISDDHKHLGFFLDSELNFLRHVKEAITKYVLDQLYKLYVRPHLDYGDVLSQR